jgi:hypothetical protein
MAGNEEGLVMYIMLTHMLHVHCLAYVLPTNIRPNSMVAMGMSHILSGSCPPP